MRIFELTVTAKSNPNLISKSGTPTLNLPYDIELTSPTGQKAMHKTGTRVYYKVINTMGEGFKIKLWRTVFSTVLQFDNKAEFESEGFKL